MDELDDLQLATHPDMTKAWSDIQVFYQKEAYIIADIKFHWLVSVVPIFASLTWAMSTGFYRPPNFWMGHLKDYDDRADGRNSQNCSANGILFTENVS